VRVIGAGGFLGIVFRASHNFPFDPTQDLRFLRHYLTSTTFIGIILKTSKTGEITDSLSPPPGVQIQPGPPSQTINIFFMALKSCLSALARLSKFNFSILIVRYKMVPN
jgi:hypothetical protein